MPGSEREELERIRSITTHFPQVNAVHSFVKEIGITKQHYPINSKVDLHEKVGGPDKVLHLMGEDIPLREVIAFVPAIYFPIVDEDNLIEKAVQFFQSLDKDSTGMPKRPIRPRPIRPIGRGGSRIQFPSRRMRRT